MTTYVLVPGANHGGWWFDDVAAALRADGHTVLALTLPGLDPEAPAPSHAATLEEHVAFARDAVRSVIGPAAEPRDTVLVGHSYGGLIISAIADANPGRFRASVYLDAFLPEDGESSWSLINEWERTWYGEGTVRTGAFVDPLPFFDGRARPHPLPTLMQGVHLTGAWREVPLKIYVEATGWPDGESPLAVTTERAKADDTITVHSWDTTHNVLKDGPERVLELIRDL